MSDKIRIEDCSFTRVKDALAALEAASSSAMRALDAAISECLSDVDTALVEQLQNFLAEASDYTQRIDRYCEQHLACADALYRRLSAYDACHFSGAHGNGAKTPGASPSGVPRGSLVKRFSNGSAGTLRKLPPIPPPVYDPEKDPYVPDIAPLPVTMQESHTVADDSGQETLVFDHPESMTGRLSCAQGKNALGYLGTCGLAQIGNWLTLAGSRARENEVVAFAGTHQLCSTVGMHREQMGGTTAENRCTVLKRFGIPSIVLKSYSTAQLASAVESGHAVLLSVNAGVLWSRDDPDAHACQASFGDGRSNHVVGVISTVRDSSTHKLLALVINDTGRGLARDAARAVPITDFEAACRVAGSTATVSKQPVW